MCVILRFLICIKYINVIQRIKTNMKETAILFLVLVTNSNGKVVSSGNDISSNFITALNKTISKQPNNNVQINTNISDVSNDHITEVKAKSVPADHIATTVYVKENNKIAPVKKNRDKSENENSIKESNKSNQVNPRNCVYTKSNEIDYNAIIEDYIFRCDPPEKIDNGTALVLTPYIENGQIAEARNACKVNPDVFLGFESYSGFITVNKTYNSNMFFWYFPVEKKNVSATPWIIWLQGGPGISSLVGLFDEMGPFKFSSLGTLKKNPHTWLQNHSLVFIDNPVGTGYSFTEHTDGFAKDMDTYGKHLYEVVKQFLQIFPELRKAPLFVAGESYAGKYVPALAIEIHKHKDLLDTDINLQGLIIGNPYVDPSELINVTDLYLHFGLLTREQVRIVDPLLTAFKQHIADKNSIEAKYKWSSLISVILFLTHQKQAYNFLKDEITFGQFAGNLKESTIKRALHVGDISYSFLNITVNSFMSHDFLSSATPLYEELLNHYRVLAYCGQLDQMMSCVFTSEHYRTWKWNETSEFLEAARYPYIFNKKVAGYHKTGGRLTEVVIRGAGHMVPMDKPAPIQNLVARWTHNQPLSRRFGLLEGSYVQEFVRNHSLAFF